MFFFATSDIVLTEITKASSHTSKTSFQYSFCKGIKEFTELIHNTTKEKLRQNVLGIYTVEIVEPLNFNPDLCIDILTYLMFLKKTKRIKIHGCVDDQT